MRTEIHTLRPLVTLTALLWEPSPNLQDASRPRPAVLICPGGGYQFLSEKEADPVALRFASMGYQAFILRYGVYGPEESGMPPHSHCTHPHPMLDIARAMLHIRDHAEAYHLNPEQIILCGFSAGGHNVLMYATHWHRPVVTQAFSRPAEDFRPAACVAGYALVDELLLGEGHPLHPRMAVCQSALLGTASPSRALLEETAPSLHVTPHTPPTFLWATQQDAKVPVGNTLRMAQALAAAGVPFDLHIFEQGEHGLSLADASSAGVSSKVQPRAAQWVSLCQSWLEKRFPLMLA